MVQDEEHHHKSPLRLFLSRTARQLGFRWYDMYYLERSLDRPIPAIDASLPLEIALATLEDQRSILAGREARHRPRLQRHFDSDRTRCYVARTEGKVAGYSFLKSGLMDITGLDCVELPIVAMPDDAGLTHDSYVWPSFRGNRIFHALLRHVYLDRKAAGLSRVCNLIDPANASSLKVHLDMGAKTQRVYFLKLPGTGAMIVGRRFEIGRLDRARAALPDPA